MVIRRCVIANNRGLGVNNRYDSTGPTFSFNYIGHNGNLGLQTGAANGTFIHNVFDDNAAAVTNDSYRCELLLYKGHATNNLIENNVFIGNNAKYAIGWDSGGASPSGTNADYNYYASPLTLYPAPTATPPNVYGTHSITGSSAGFSDFASVDSENFSLTTDSVCRNAGINLGFGTDIGMW